MGGEVVLGGCCNHLAGARFFIWLLGMILHQLGEKCDRCLGGGGWLVLIRYD